MSLFYFFQVTKRHRDHPKSSVEDHSISYKHNNTHFYSKISFFWLNCLLWSGYESPLEEDDLGELPDDERSTIYYHKFKAIYNPNKKVIYFRISLGNISIEICSKINVKTVLGDKARRKESKYMALLYASSVA